MLKSVFIVNFEHPSHLFLVFPLNKSIEQVNVSRVRRRHQTQKTQNNKDTRITYVISRFGVFIE